MHYEQWNKLAVIFNIANNVKLNIASRKKRRINDILKYLSSLQVVALFCLLAGKCIGWVVFFILIFVRAYHAVAYAKYMHIAYALKMGDATIARNAIIFANNKILVTNEHNYFYSSKVTKDGERIARDIEMSNITKCFVSCCRRRRRRYDGF